MSSSSEPPNPDQLSPLPGVHRHITTHNSDGLAIFHSSTTSGWKTFTPSMAFNVVYTTSISPPNMNNDMDISNHEALCSSGKLGLVNPNGSVCRIVDFGPSSSEEHTKPVMHRTQSLDYGIVLEGVLECILDSGEKRVMRRGDVAVQRGTMHAWRNTSSTDWARMIFVLLDSEKVKVGGKELGEDLQGAPGDLKDMLESQH
ncbi:MAG: hypothetical protein Q9201_003111 [Fulgogasparrea decipioides]